LLGRKRAHDFLEARIATQRIPPWVKTQLTVAEVAGQLYGDLQLLQGQVLLASHRVNDREILNYSGTSNRIFGYWQELDCAPAFTDRVFFMAECVICEGQNTEDFSTISQWQMAHSAIKKTRSVKAGAQSSS